MTVTEWIRALDAMPSGGRRPSDPKAGRWVAYRDEPLRIYDKETRRYGPPVEGEFIRYYLHTAAIQGMKATEATRFDTRAKALRAARDRWPAKQRGHRIGAERVDVA